MMIDAELCRNYHGSISTTTIGRGLKPIYARTDPKHIKLIVKVKNAIIFGMRFSPSKFVSFSLLLPILSIQSI
jgi:hypothetical protein